MKICFASMLEAQNNSKIEVHIVQLSYDYVLKCQQLPHLKTSKNGWPLSKILYQTVSRRNYSTLIYRFLKRHLYTSFSNVLIHFS